MNEVKTVFVYAKSRFSYDAVHFFVPSISYSSDCSMRVTQLDI